MKAKELYPGVFSRYAAAYQRRLDEIMARGQAQGRQRVLDLLAVQPGMRVLDLACGPATLTRRLAAQAAPDGEVVGIDLAAGMIELARQVGIPNARFEVMDIEDLEFPDAAFDAAACGHGVQFAPDLGRCLREVRRVLRPGGKFAASVPAGSPGQRPWQVVGEVVDRYLPPAPVPDDQRPTRAVVGDPAAFRNAALSAGFAEARVEVISEKVRWKSSEELVSLFLSWWDCAVRMEGIGAEKRAKFVADANAALKEAFPGEIVTDEANHVLYAIT
ncbi:MAG TPA: methyltransferase domain-containing protein [Candidatus Dormibacteraeota bacterium]|nr:methyltransferase domain-containing protein [Candidatus Dormibacteraeota bacterium]